MSLKKLTEHPIISSLAASFIVWLATLIFPQSRKWWVDLFTAKESPLLGALRWLWTDVSTPRAIFWFLLLFFVGVVGILAVILVSATLESKSVDSPPTQPKPNLSDDETRLLKALAEQDGSPLWLHHLQEILGASRLRTEHTVALLRGKGLIEWLGDHHGGSGYLSSRGREMAVLQRWVT